MNILHIKYAVEVARVGSLNKAAQNLIIAQPNLSRSIKELESDLGIKIFERSAKGMTLTPEGAKFIGYAQEILNQIDQVEMMYKKGAEKKRRFSVSVPRACYISDAFSQFSKKLKYDSVELFYKETNTRRTLSNVLDSEYRLGIVRYAESYDKYFKSMMEEKHLAYELIAEFSYCLIMSREHALADKENITFDDLLPFIEISHADPLVPSLSLSVPKRDEIPDNVKRKIFVFERASQFDLLSENPDTFMWVSPAPEKVLKRYGLVQRHCSENTRIYRDVLIYRDEYKLTEMDKEFITELCMSRRQCIK